MTYPCQITGRTNTISVLIRFGSNKHYGFYDLHRLCMVADCVISRCRVVPFRKAITESVIHSKMEIVHIICTSPPEGDIMTMRHCNYSKTRYRDIRADLSNESQLMKQYIKKNNS